MDAADVGPTYHGAIVLLKEHKFGVSIRAKDCFVVNNLNSAGLSSGDDLRGDGMREASKVRAIA